MQLLPLELGLQEISRRKHEEFMRYMWQRPFDPFVVGLHTKKICERLDHAVKDFRRGKSTYLAIMVPFGHGKLLADDTPVMTPAGWRMHGDLHFGDYVFGRDGTPRMVLAESAPGYADMEVEFWDGTKICAHAEHEWVVYDRSRHRERIVETRELVGVHGHDRRSRFLVDHNVTLEYEEADLRVPPYVLGYWLGNGSRDKNCVTHAECDSVVVERIRSIGYDDHRVCVHSTTGVHTTYFHDLYADLVSEGLLGEKKHIPEKYQIASVEQRLQLLAGLIDSDGYVAKGGKVCFSNTNEVLIGDVKRLLNGLGCKVTIHRYEPQVSSSGIVGKLPVYQILFVPSVDIPVALPRKKIKTLCMNRMRGIKTVSKCRPRPGKCIQVSGDGVYLAGETNIPTHNSDIVSRYFPAHWAGMFPDHPVIVTGYSSGLTEGFSSDCQSIMRDDRFQKLYPGVEISKKKASADEWHIEGRMGKLYWPGLTGSITGKRAALGICDDFFSGREEAESETIRNARWNTLVNDFLTRAYTHCVIVILATPWHVDDFFGRIKKRMAESSRFPAFEFLKFPAFSDEYPTGTLFPERYNESWYEGQRETLGPYATASLMQCDPVVEHGNYFRIDKIKFYEKPPTDRVRWTRGWDLALTEKQTIKDDPDFTAGIRLGVEWLPAIPGAEPMPVLYIDDFVLGRWEVHKRDHVIRQTAMEDGEIEIGVEAYGTQRESYDRLSAALYGVRTVTKRNPPKDLFARADAVRKCFEVGNVFMRRAPWNDELLRYLAEYPGAAHDDPIAALVTAFELHKPFVKHVFPHMISMNTQPFDIHWGKRDERTSLHYGAVSMRKDLSLWVLATLWDDIAGSFFVYDCRSFDEPDVEKAVSWMGVHMRLRQYRVDRILCNDRMSEGSDGAEKNMQKLFRDEFKRQKLLARLTEPTRYDQWGAISQINRLCTDRKIFFNDVTEPALMQFSGWSLDKGKPTDDGNIGYCEALCLIVAELKKKQVFKQKFRPGDYMRREEYQKKLMQDPLRLERTAV